MFVRIVRSPLFYSKIMWPLVLITSLAGAEPMSEYAAEDKAVDELIVNAANSSQEFEFFYDDKNKLVKLEYDIVYTMEEYEEAYDEGEDEYDEFYRKKRTAAVVWGNRGAKKWTGSRIPYEYSLSDFTDREQNIIESAMEEWSKHTCLIFHEEVEVDDRLLFKNAGGCFSRVGMVGGKQVVGLADNCRFKGVVLHELGHAIGLHHEQTRPDREKHVTIRSENIPEPMKFNFQKYGRDTVKDMGIPYDYSSIMHYGKNAFSLNGKPTIMTIDPKMQDTIGQKHGLSFRDIKTVNIMYGCNRAKADCTKEDSECPGEGFVGKDCQCWCPGSPIQPCAQGGGNKNGGGEAIAKKSTGGKTEKECEDQHKSCPYWAGIGECKKNPSYMLIYCKVSCKTCGKNAQVAPKKVVTAVTASDTCQDLHTSCQYWAGKGHCQKGFVPYMKTNCKKSCGKCPGTARSSAQSHPGAGTSCEDHNYFCESWATTGECIKNPAYMNTQCKLSCGLCSNDNQHSGAMMSEHSNCLDHSHNCNYWAGIGECDKNKLYMHAACKKSCRLCW